MIGIYKITNPKGRIYIGQAINIEYRFKLYRRLGCNRQPKLYNSLKKYGSKSHIFEIIEECPIEYLDELETWWKLFYGIKCVEKGLCCSYWDKGGGPKSEETKIKIRTWWRNNRGPRSIETIEKIKATKRSNPSIMTEERKLKHRNNSTSKKPIIQYDLNLNILNEFISINESSRQTGIRNDSISACIRGKQNTAGGYIWKYKNK